MQNEKVTDVVAEAICEALFGPYELTDAESSPHSPSGQARQAAKAAIDAYHDYIRRHS